MILLFLISIATAKELPGEELYSAPQKLQVTNLEQEDETTQKPNDKGIANKVKSYLPTEYLNKSTNTPIASELVLPQKGASELFKGVRVGDTIPSVINHSVIAFGDERSPIIAEIKSGILKGIKLIGDSILEPNTKRIFLNFNKLTIGHQIYSIKAIGVSPQGQPGLMGEYHSQELNFFTGNFIANFIAGYFDGLIPRKTNAFGQIEGDSSVDSAVKKGLTSSALSSADRFKEKLKKVPEFSELKGPFDLNILILEQAKSTN